MKTQIALASVSLSLLGGLVSVSSAEAAGLFSNGDQISGGSGTFGLYNQSLDPDSVPGVPSPGPALNYFGTTVDGVPQGTPGVDSTAGIFINGPGFTGFNYAEITDPNVAATTQAETTVGFGDGGFTMLSGADGLFRSFQSGVAPDTPGNIAPTLVKDFLVLTNEAMAFTVKVDLNGVIESGVTPGEGLGFSAPVIVTGEKDGDIQVVDGIFRFTTQNVPIGEFLAVDAGTVDLGDAGSPTYTLESSSAGQSYSWQLEVVKNVPEPSSMVSLLALSALGAGMAMKRKVSK